MNEKAIELLCEKFGTTVEFLVPKAQAYGIWTNAIGIAICSLIMALETWYLLHLRKKYGDELEYEAEEWECAFVIVGAFFSVIAIVIMIISIDDLIMWIAAPELGLLKFVK